MKKKGIELSVNFIIMVILAILVFGFGLKFAKDIFSKGTEITEMKFEQIDEQIQELACSTSERVCLPTTTKTFVGTNPVFFGVVIENVLDTQDFTVSVEKASNTLSFSKLEWMPKTNNEARTVNIGSKEEYKVGIVVANNGAPSETYPFKVTVKKVDGTDYSTPKVFYVKVP